VGRGDRTQAEACVSELEARAGRGEAPPASLALALLGVGRFDAALARLTEAVAARAVALYQLAVDPVYDPLRHDPRFDALLSQMRLPKLFG
jgi:hypothetical protein